MKCSKCGNDNKLGSTFCEKCGAKLEKSEEDKKKSKEELKAKVLKIKYKIAIVLGIIWIIALAIVIILFIIYHGKQNREFNTNSAAEGQSSNTQKEVIIEDNLPTMQFEDIEFTLTEENKYEDYDDDGLNNEQEVAAGTNVYFEDTDNDGLTDYEELNRYNSNPLKESTADDGVSDFIKVKKGLDVNTECNINDITIDNITVGSNITLIPKDLESSVKGEYESFSTDYVINSYSPIFTVYSFEGKIEYKVNKDNLMVLVKYNGKYEEYDDYKSSAELITINISKEDNSKNFLIVSKENYDSYMKGSEEQ